METWYDILRRLGKEHDLPELLVIAHESEALVARLKDQIGRERVEWGEQTTRLKHIADLSRQPDPDNNPILRLAQIRGITMEYFDGKAD